MQQISFKVLSSLFDKIWSYQTQYEDEPLNPNPVSTLPFSKYSVGFYSSLFSNPIVFTLLFVHLINHSLKTIFYQVLGEVDP